MARIVYFCFGFFSIISTICAVSGMGVVIGCYSSTVKIYNGHQQTTKDGIPCVRWDSVNKGSTKSKYIFPDKTLSDAANYCRAMDKEFLWCWKNSSEWGKCGIKKCDDIDFITNCGTLNIEQPALLGRNVTFSFTPDSHDPNAILEWQRTTKPNPWYTRPLNYKFTQFYEDGIYYMILTNSTAENDENVYRILYYNESIQCLMETKSRLILKVPPSAPKLKGLKDIDGCKECIVGNFNERMEVHCETSGGTQPITANVTIGDESFTALHNDKDTSVYTAFFTISTDRHHNETITCSIMNGALSSPLTTSTKLYVIKSPIVALSLPDEIKEGRSDNITCMVSSSRPAPKVYFDISGTEVNSAFNHTTQTIILETFNRDWNGKNISCCRSNRWFKPRIKCSEPKMINLLFPPSRSKLEIRFDPDDLLQMYAVCMVYNSNPVCKVKFMSARGVLGSEKSSRIFSLPHGAWDSSYTVNLNVTKEIDGKNISCVVICENFDSLELRDTSTIVIPYRPEIEFNTSGSSLDISKGEVTYVKCLADSFPASNITWMEELDEGVIIKHQCDFESECVLDINADVISKRQFVCAIDYLLIHDNKTLSVNIYSPRKQDQLLIWIITGAGSALVLIGVILAIIIRNKRSNVKAKPIKNQTDHRSNSLPASGNREYDHQNENTYAADPMDVTYSQPIKNRKVSAEQEATYSVVNKVEKSTNQATTCTAKEQEELQSKKLKREVCQPYEHSEEGQLTYIELDFDPNKSALKRATANRRNSPTEYVAIDFVKTAAHVANEDDMPETDNIYANQ